MSNKLITKSDFIKYLECPDYFWFHKKRPEVLEKLELSDFDKELIKNGELVEIWARKLFPQGVLVNSKENFAIQETQKLLDEGSKTIFQATFQTEHLYAMIDIFDYDTLNDYWVINEVKATSAQNKKKDQHIFDAAFQYVLMKESGFSVGKVNLIELNKEFRKEGEINAYELFKITDITSAIKEIEGDLNLMIADMVQILERDTEPPPCNCIYKSRGNHCPAFKYLYPEVPDYSIHDIVRIGASLKKLVGLIEAGHYRLEEVPEDYKLTKYQRNQVDVTQTKNMIIKTIEIKEKLDELKYPLNFLDYETYPTAIPIYDGCSPYQQVPFQYSLHVMRSPDAELEHYEYLHTDSNTHPMIALANSLMKSLENQGHIIVWNKKFEGKCHDDLALLMPEHAEIFASYNKRFFDLMEIFQKNLYVHHNFKGGYSIKDVLPVLVPGMSYNDLNIKDGSMAMNGWKKMIFECTEKQEKEQLKRDLLEYCKLDTLAMVRIFDFLNNLK